MNNDETTLIGSEQGSIQPSDDGTNSVQKEKKKRRKKTTTQRKASEMMEDNKPGPNTWPCMSVNQKVAARVICGFVAGLALRFFLL